ncbi:hypothetical protein M569_14589, partial [Genlisea aurea]
WLAQEFIKLFRLQPNFKARDFRRQIKYSIGCTISMKAAYRAMSRALEIISGSDDDQYNYMWRYCDQLRLSNPGSTVILKLQDDGPNKRFQRFYCCFSAIKHGFKVGCRPLFGIDGCFLKGKYEGQIVAAVGMDANNNIYPIAYGLVERENQETWEWFLDLLKSDLDLEGTHVRNCVCISDRQKGLVPAVQHILPAIQVRHCCRHIYANIKGAGHKSMELKQLFWKAAQCSREEDFNTVMEKIKNQYPAAHSYLKKIDSTTWTRAFFSENSRCDILLNNICESFNHMIGECRDMPILCLLGYLQIVLTVRIQQNNEKSAKWNSRLCPRIMRLLVKLSDEGNKGTCIPSDETQFTWVGSNEQHLVDLRRRDCSCRRWALTGIPCKHACACINYIEANIENFVEEWYTVAVYRLCYSKVLSAVIL